MGKYGSISIKECLSNMTKEESRVYFNKNATEYYIYITQSNEFQESLERLEEKDWIYLFEKLYLVTYKSLKEEKSHIVMDGVLYLFSKLGYLLTKKGSTSNNEFYKLLQVSQTPFLERRINNDLLLGLETVMNSGDEEQLDTLLKQHKEASEFRSHRDYLYEEDEIAEDGELTSSEIAAINCLNRSYQREKTLVLKYKNMV